MKETLIAGMLVTLLLATAAVSAQSDVLNIERPFMRDITISFSSQEVNSITCQVWQRIIMFLPYEYSGSFTVNSGESYNMNIDNWSPIYRDVKFDCTAGIHEIIVNSVFLVGGQTIEVPITNTVTQTTTQTETVTNTTTETTTSPGYILPGDCGSYDGWIQLGDCPSCPICPSCPAHTCHPNGQWCSGNSDCCSTDCRSNVCFQCKSNGNSCSGNSDCCSNYCWKTGSGHDNKCHASGCYDDNHACSVNSDCCSNDCQDNGWWTGCPSHCVWHPNKECA